MVSAVGSFPIPSAVSTTVASTAAIEAQIARYKQELSNCVNCETAKTMQGKANIQALTSKISILESRLEKVTTSNPDDQPAAPYALPIPTPQIAPP